MGVRFPSSAHYINFKAMKKPWVSVCIIVSSYFLFACSRNINYRPSGFSEREASGITWLFPPLKDWNSMESMTSEDYQQLVNKSYLIEMVPFYAYISNDNNCPQGLVVSITSKFSEKGQTEFEFIQRAPSGVKELEFENEAGDKVVVLYVVYSVKLGGKNTRVVLIYYKDRILGFEMRRLVKCSKSADYELVDFVREFLKLNS